MSLGKQWQVIKQNWLISLVVVLLLISVWSNSFGGYYGGADYGATKYFEEGLVGVSRDSAVSREGIASSYYPSTGDIAPETEDRSIVKTASLRSETERGKFEETENSLKSIVKAAEGFILYENVYVSGEEEREQAKHGRYDVRIPISSYDNVIMQLKQLGKTQYFTESSDDITAYRVNLEDELNSEKARLERYKQLLSEAATTEEKLQLVDRIFNQERTINYLEESLKNVGERVSYSRISVSLDEKESGYASVLFVKFSELVSALVSNLNSVLLFLFGALPWAIAIGIIWLFVRWVRKR